MRADFQSPKQITLGWGWGMLLIAELLLGEIFINQEKDGLILVLGLIFLIIGILLVPVPYVLFPRKGQVQKGENFLSTTVIVDSGIYSLVRHPQYLGWSSIIVSFILIRQHLIITMIGAIALVLLYLSTMEEEKDLIDKFGSNYRNYMKVVPRWNLPLGIVFYVLRKMKRV